MTIAAILKLATLLAASIAAVNLIWAQTLACKDERLAHHYEQARALAVTAIAWIVFVGGSTSAWMFAEQLASIHRLNAYAAEDRPK